MGHAHDGSPWGNSNNDARQLLLGSPHLNEVCEQGTGRGERGEKIMPSLWPFVRRLGSGLSGGSGEGKTIGRIGDLYEGFQVLDAFMLTGKAIVARNSSVP